MNFQDAIDFIFPLKRFGQKPGLQNIQQLCDKLGNPERQLGKVIHVAGTNGKGSVSAMVASIAKESGQKVGLYTSPHLVSFTERIRVNGKPIPEEKVAQICLELKSEIEEIGATFFEVTTAMAFKFFADEKIDIAVIETGMGGRLDATNIVPSDFTIITSVGLEHTEWLGETTDKIAAEKAAIIRQDSHIVTGVRDLDALEVITKVARERNAKIHIAPALIHIQVVSESISDMSLHVRSLRRSYHGFKFPFLGTYQTENIAIAILTAEQLDFSEETIRKGIQHLAKNTGFRARLEIVSHEPITLLDVTHNAFGMRKTIQTLLKFRSQFQKIHVVFACVNGKDAGAMLGSLKELTDKVYLPTMQTARAKPASELKALCDELGIEAQQYDSCEAAFDAATQNASSQDLVLNTGSFYLGGELLGAKQWPNVQQFEE